MNKIKKVRSARDEIMKSAMCSDFDKMKEIYTKNNSELGSFGGWMLLADIFKHTCNIMNIPLLNALYDTYDKLDMAIRLDDDSNIFQKCLLTSNMEFFHELISHDGPKCVLKNNIEKLSLLLQNTNNKTFMY